MISSVFDAVLGHARKAMATKVHDSVRDRSVVLADFREPRGDPGLFGTGSPAWRVHADLATMLIGGISALMLQTLHPLAMAGVDRHSRFREDPLGRLRRTARFIAGTTFGSRRMAERMIEEVRRIHTRVQGVADDGRRYEASDPALLTWVHVAESMQFLASYQRYSGTPIPSYDEDRYFDEVAIVAEKLGARGVPRSRREVQAFLSAQRAGGELRVTPAAREAVEFLRRPPEVARTKVERMAYGVLVAGAVDLLPSWAREMLELRQPEVLTPLVQRAAFAASSVLRWAGGPSPLVVLATERARATSW